MVIVVVIFVDTDARIVRVDYNSKKSKWSKLRHHLDIYVITFDILLLRSKAADKTFNIYFVGVYFQY